MFSAFNKFGKLGSPAGGRSLLAQIQAMGASFIGIPSLSNYQDSAGTTLVTQPGGGSADPPVGLVVDLSGNANNASQATSTARPVLSALANYAYASEDMANAAWTKQSGAVATNELLYPSYNANYVSIYQDCRQSRFFSFEVKSSGKHVAMLWIPSGSAVEMWFNSNDGAFQVIGGHQVTSEMLPDGYYKFNIQTVGGPLNYFQIGLSDAMNSVSVTANGQDGILLRKLQASRQAAPYQMSTSALVYDASAAPLYWKFDGVDDVHNVTFPSSLGSSCTVVTANLYAAPTIQTAQTIGTSLAISTNHCGKLVFDRALTGAETAIVTQWANQRGGL